VHSSASSPSVVEPGYFGVSGATGGFLTRSTAMAMGDGYSDFTSGGGKSAMADQATIDFGLGSVH
jgi:hypothetical protein